MINMPCDHHVIMACDDVITMSMIIIRNLHDSIKPHCGEDNSKAPQRHHISITRGVLHAVLAPPNRDARQPAVNLLTQLYCAKHTNPHVHSHPRLNPAPYTHIHPATHIHG